jgi:hypothetical protein
MSMKRGRKAKASSGPTASPDTTTKAFKAGDRVRLVFDFAGGHFDGHGRVVRIFDTGSPVVRPDGWDHDFWPGLSEIERVGSES